MYDSSATNESEILNKNKWFPNLKLGRHHPQYIVVMVACSVPLCSKLYGPMLHLLIDSKLKLRLACEQPFSFLRRSEIQSFFICNRSMVFASHMGGVRDEIHPLRFRTRVHTFRTLRTELGHRDYARKSVVVNIEMLRKPIKCVQHNTYIRRAPSNDTIKVIRRCPHASRVWLNEMTYSMWALLACRHSGRMFTLAITHFQEVKNKVGADKSRGYCDVLCQWRRTNVFLCI